MSVDTPAQASISINALLAAEGQYAAHQADWLAHYQQPVISLILVTPGAMKDSIRYRNMMGATLQACDQLLWKYRWQALDRQVLWLLTEPKTLWCMVRPTSGIEAMCNMLGQNRPLGRLWDIGVICPQNGQVGRQSLDESQRHYLLYDGPAHACTRNRRHDTNLVVARVEQMIDAWLARN